MNLDQFVDKYNGKSVSNNHGNFKGECVSLAARYAQEVQGVDDGDNALYCANVGGARDLYEWYGKPGSNVQEFYDRIPFGQPRLKGDMVVWGTNLGYYGDIAIALDSGIQIFGQLGTPVFIPANIRTETRQPLGYLRRKGDNSNMYPTEPELQAVTAQTGWQKDSSGKTNPNAIAYWCYGTGNPNWGDPVKVRIELDNELYYAGRAEGQSMTPGTYKPYTGKPLFTEGT